MFGGLPIFYGRLSHLLSVIFLISTITNCSNTIGTAVQILCFIGFLGCCPYSYSQPIVLRICSHTSANRSVCLIHAGTSLFIQPIITTISLCISSTRFRFQQMDSLWNTLFRNMRNWFNGEDTFFRCRRCLGMYGNALRKSFHKRRSYSLFNKETQNPKVSSAVTLEGVMGSCRPAICLFA